MNARAADIAYGREIARQLAALDLGQAVVMSDRACVAIEAMEGTDETIERAARLSRGSPGRGQSQQAAAGHAIRCTRSGSANRRSDEASRRHRAGHRFRPHLLFDRANLMEAADAAGIAIEAFARRTGRNQSVAQGNEQGMTEGGNGG